MKHFRSIRTIQDYLVKSGEGGLSDLWLCGTCGLLFFSSCIVEFEWRWYGCRSTLFCPATTPCAADKHAIPKVDNTNVDRSVATIHTTVLGCLRRTARVSGGGGGGGGRQSAAVPACSLARPPARGAAPGIKTWRTYREKFRPQAAPAGCLCFCVHLPPCRASPS